LLRGRRLLRVIWPVVIGTLCAVIVVPPTAAYADPSVSQIEQQIKQESASLERVVEQYDKLNEQLKANQAQAATELAKIVPLDLQMRAASDQVGKMAARAYIGGPLASTSILLTSGSPADFADQLSTFDQLARVQQQQVDAFTAAKAARNREASRLATVVKQQQAQRDQLAAQQTKINSELSHLYELRKQAYGRAQAAANASSGSNSSGGSNRPVPPYVPGKAGIAVRYAYGALGKPYEWAADGPDSYDCSGLTMAAWRAAGISLPHNAEMQWNSMPHLKRSAIQPGDLVFYSNLGHVAIYVGNGNVIQAPTFGENVQVSPVDFMTPYGYGRPD
jgi:cell wall-associated NlpC family hydrolase